MVTSGYLKVSAASGYLNLPVSSLMRLRLTIHAACRTSFADQYQVENVQAKLIWATLGEIYDVIVDMRRSSPDFGCWYGITLSANNKRRLLVPKGFAHGFLVLSQAAEITYLTSDIYNPAGERFLRWNCPEIGINWPVSAPKLNDRDATAPGFGDCETYA